MSRGTMRMDEAKVRGALALLLFVAGCVAVASSEPLYDTLYLKSGDRVEGTVLEARDGKYWIQLPDGRVRSFPYEEVERVFEAPDDLRAAGPAPERRAEPREPREQPLVGGGVDLGLVTAGRLRFRLENPVLDSVDVRGGVATTLLMSGLSSLYPAPGLFVGPEIAFLGDAPVHPTLNLKTGVVFYSSAYPWVSTGAGVRFDMSRHVELHLSTDIGFVIPSYVAIAPDAGVSFVW